MQKKEVKALQDLNEMGGKEKLDAKKILEQLFLVGLLRRSGLDEKEAVVVRASEKMFFQNMESLEEAVLQSEETGHLKSLVENLLEKPEDAQLLEAFRRGRDRGELIYQMVRDYFSKTSKKLESVLRKIRRDLDEADGYILFHPELSRKFIDLHRGKKCYLGPGIFWWISSGSEQCPVPARKRDLYLTGYGEAKLPREMKKIIEKHLQQCEECREAMGIIQEILYQELMEFFQPRLAAAQGMEIPDLTSLVWKDEDGRWSVCLYLTETGPDPELSFHIKGESLPGGTRLTSGAITLSIEKNSTPKISREKIKSALKKERGTIHLIFADGVKIPLNYRGKE